MKVNTTKTVKSEVYLDSQLDSMAKKMGKALAKEPFDEIVIPEAAGADNTVECCLNGYTYVMKRGVKLKLPLPIISLLQNSGVI